MKTIRTTEIFDAWIKNLNDRRAVARIETRIHNGPGYRVYFAQRGQEIVVLLAGGDKSTQSKDIKTALKLGRQL